MLFRGEWQQLVEFQFLLVQFVLGIELKQLVVERFARADEAWTRLPVAELDHNEGCFARLEYVRGGFIEWRRS